MDVKTASQPNNKESASTLGFTEDQEKAYKGLLEFINSDFNPNDYKRSLTGAAGTGKTYLVKALIKNCLLAYSQIGLAAPTHKACRVLEESISIKNIKVHTLASDLGFRLNFNVENFDISNPPFDPKGRVKIGDYQVYIVDEASMINSNLCKYLEKVCSSNRCKIIFIGDKYQLCPVRERYIYAFKGVRTYELNKIVRQEDDNPVKPLLQLLRYDIVNKSFTFLQYISRVKEHFDEYHTKGFKVCNDEEFKSMVGVNFNNEELTRNVDYAKIIGYTNIAISGWNKYVRNNIIQDASTSVLTKNDLIISYATIVDVFNDVVIANSEEYIIQDIVNYVHQDFNIKGFLVRFIAIHGGKITSPLFILDHNDFDSVKKYVQISQSMIHAAKTAPSKMQPSKWKEYYAFKEGCLLLTNIANAQGEIIYSRDLDYGFSLTSHKS